jgi:hypothetical protein
MEMKEKSLHAAVVDALYLKIPKKNDLADYLAQTLCIEKETAYRRLRGAIHFTLDEVCVLVKKLNISLDNLVAENESRINKKMIMAIPVQNLEEAYEEKQITSIINHLNMVVEGKNSEYGSAISEIPFSLYSKFRFLSRFFLLKYKLLSGEEQSEICFADIKESDAKIGFRDEIKRLYHQIKYTYYVWDKTTIKTLVSDIKAAYSLRLIDRQDVEELRKELNQLLNNLEILAKRGYYEETGNKFELYISDIHVDMNYIYMCSNKDVSSLLSTFVVFHSHSSDSFMFNRINTWVKSLRRYSTLITGIGERERIEFFEAQYAIIENGLKEIR